MPADVTNPSTVTVATTAPATPSSQAPASAPQTTPSTGAPQSVAAPSVQGGAAATPTSQPTTSWLDTLKSQGVDIQAGNEQEAFTKLGEMYKEHQRLSQLAPYTREFIQNRHQYDEWRRAQSQPKPAAPAQDENKPWWSKYWQPPVEYDRSMESLVTRDADGNLVPAPGAPPDVVSKVATYHHWRQQQADKLMSNPFTFFEEPIKTLAAQIAQEQVQKHLSQYQDTQKASEFVGQNMKWLYEQAGDGQVKYALDPMSGKQTPVLSQWGGKFRDYVLQEQERQKQRGYADLAEQQTNALQRVQLDFALSELSKLKQTTAAPATPSVPAPTTREQANQDFLSRNGTKPTGPTTPANVNAPAQPRGSLQEMMRAKFKEQGMTLETAV